MQQAQAMLKQDPQPMEVLEERYTKLGEHCQELMGENRALRAHLAATDAPLAELQRIRAVVAAILTAQIQRRNAVEALRMPYSRGKEAQLEESISRQAMVERAAKAWLAHLLGFPESSGSIFRDPDQNELDIATLRTALQCSYRTVPVGEPCRFIAINPANWHDGPSEPDACMVEWSTSDVERLLAEARISGGVR